MNRYKNSQNAFTKAKKYLPAGTTSNARLWKNVCLADSSCGIYGKKAKGAYIWDLDGNKYIDYRLGFGPVILGHSYQKIRDAVHKIDGNGLVYALDNELEIEVAKKVNRMVRCAEMVRYTNSGTESTMTALRIARGYTKKEKIIKFEGHYHGHHDYLLFSLPKHIKDHKDKKPVQGSLGIPKAISKLVYTEEWNDFSGVEKNVRRNHKEIAAIICEPVTGNSSVILPTEGFLKHLRELCNKYNIALIFDEVKTGFRLAPGGAQEVYKVTPDLAAFAKSLANGYPIGLVAGKKEFMSLIGPGKDKVFHGGTYSGNPVSMAAANATLDELRKDEVFEHLNSYGRELIRKINKLYDDYNLSAIIQGFPTMFQSLFTEKEQITNCRDKNKFCDISIFSELQKELMKKGIMIDEDSEEAVYTSFSHKKEELKKTLDAYEDAIKSVKVFLGRHHHE